MSNVLRIHTLNDLHLEATRWGDCPGEGAPPASDLVVLAGDTWHGTKGVEWAAARWPDTPVAYVLGNHELQGEWPEKLIDRARAIAPGHVHVLEDSTVDVAGVRIIGATFWSDFALAGLASQKSAMQVARARMPEYKFRPNEDGWKLTPEETLVRHKESASRIHYLAQIARRDGMPVVVVTHHPPLGKELQSFGPRASEMDAHGYVTDSPGRRNRTMLRENTISDAAWSSNCRDLVDVTEAGLWVFGHTHRHVDRVVGGTRFVSNSRGITSINGPAPKQFDPMRVVEFDASGVATEP